MSEPEALDSAPEAPVDSQLPSATVDEGVADLNASREAVPESGKRPAYWGDRLFYRMAFVAFMFTALVCIGLGFWAWKDPNGEREVPDFLIALASTSIGAVAGVFAGASRD